ncbi:esterase family protein 1 [Sphingopyxis fribergensis]|uniref:Esterase family protein 1 n=1 Tax=Sphingopyxis fribergensis TaxID=1515612 RepID=A0A0A7PIY1_9SPHN|nr:esterase family protein 1 [Sphingopyxis fribergensis]
MARGYGAATALGVALLWGCSGAATGYADGNDVAAQVVQEGEGKPYALLGSEVWDVPDPVSGRVYQVFVSFPSSYGKDPQRVYPVLYVTDADYAFPVVRQIARRLNVEGPKVQEFILVGLSYAKGDDPVQSRRRDYTPTAEGPSDAPTDAVHGGGAAYQTYLRDQVLPFVARRYRTDPRQKLFLGHSYGALLGTQILFTEPEMFSGYILGSPSLWYGKRHMFALEKAYAAAHRDMSAKVYVYTGEYEAARTADPRFNKRVDMVGDSDALVQMLKRRAYPGLQIRADVLNDEDHVSVAPRGFTKGMTYLLPVPLAAK